MSPRTGGDLASEGSTTHQNKDYICITTLLVVKLQPENLRPSLAQARNKKNALYLHGAYFGTRPLEDECSWICSYFTVSLFAYQSHRLLYSCGSLQTVDCKQEESQETDGPGICQISTGSRGFPTIYVTLRPQDRRRWDSKGSRYFERYFRSRAPAE